MRVVTKPADLPTTRHQPTVLVPTMGALHEGHLALIRQARASAGASGTVAVSVFVNPLQFDRPDDLANYPSTLQEDLETCRGERVDLVFAPTPESMYSPGHSVMVAESSLSRTLCGASRPGHFDGVCTVVLKLFNLLQPTSAIFGEKDYQQLAIIRRMVRDLNLPIGILSGPIVRESDGLALSSRNFRLTPQQRADAPRIHRALTAASVEKLPAEILEAARRKIKSPLNQVDYLELVDAETFQPVTTLHRPALLATAVCYGDVRLIDNLLLHR